MADEVWVSIGGVWTQVNSQAVSIHADLDNVVAVDAHPISAVTGLQSALDGKADVTHTHGYYKVWIESSAPSGAKVGDIWVEI